MNKLRFKGYLENYIKDLSSCGSLNVHKLVKETKTNYRLFDSLVLYCALYNKKDLFNKYTNKQHSLLLKKLNEKTFLSKTFSNYDFSKIWDGYQHRINRFVYDGDTKLRIRNNVLKQMKEKKITNYRVYTDLKLNPGNINDYLTNGNGEKVSLNVAKRIYNYVQNK